MAAPESDAEFEERVRATLEARAAALDPAVTARLRRARAGALVHVGTRRYGWTLQLAPAMAFVMAAVVVGVLALRTPAPMEPALDDFELLAGTDPLDLYEDLDFYEWLALDPQAG